MSVLTCQFIISVADFLQELISTPNPTTIFRTIIIDFISLLENCLAEERVKELLAVPDGVLARLIPVLNLREPCIVKKLNVLGDILAKVKVWSDGR